MSNLLRTSFLVFVLICYLLGTTDSVDLTLTPGAKGKDVVNAVNHLIRNSQIFPEDYRFLIRTAWMATSFGDTMISDQGGIWKVSSIHFTATQKPVEYPGLVALHTQIQNIFSINWMTLVRSNLEAPLHSALAAMLYFQVLNNTIPGTIQNQAQYWQDHYNGNSSIGIGNFINSVTELESTYTCHGKMDLVIVLDGSGSVSTVFTATKNLIADFVGTMSLSDVRVGLIRYSPNLIVFPLNNTLSLEEMQTAIRGVAIGNVGDSPELGIDAAVSMWAGVTAKQGAPHVIATFTDGGGTTSLISAAIAKAEAQNIITYAAYIGSCIDATCQNNLLIEAGGKPSQLLQLSGLEGDQLKEVTFQLNEQMCRVSQQRDVNLGDELMLNETRYYNYDVTPEGLTIVSYVKRGSYIGYWSDVVSNPSSAIHNVAFNSATVQLTIPGIPGSTRKVYIAIKGTSAAITIYSLLGVTGV